MENTVQLAEAFRKGAEAAGHKVETVSLAKNEGKGFIAEHQPLIACAA